MLELRLLVESIYYKISNEFYHNLRGIGITYMSIFMLAYILDFMFGGISFFRLFLEMPLFVGLMVFFVLTHAYIGFLHIVTDYVYWVYIRELFIFLLFCIFLKLFVLYFIVLA